MMCRSKRFLASMLAATAIIASASSAFAWWDEGHMQVADVAYGHLTAQARDQVDVLLRLNTDYPKWIANAPDEATAKKWAFVHAATWADDIKTKPYGYKRDDVSSPTAGQNIGYSDHNQHDYWHFKDISFSPDGTPLAPASTVDAVTQLKLMIAALPATSGASDDVRSYDLVWMTHLVGDLHQPLHAVTRLTHEIPGGDRGGNSEFIVPATGETVKLHAYWDAIFGGYSSAFGAVFDAEGQDGIKSIEVSEDMSKDLDPENWAKESAAIAQKYAYAAPVSHGTDATLLTRDYETNARNIARSQAALAGARLANVINAAFP